MCTDRLNLGGLKIGESFEVKEQKTGKYRFVTLNKSSHKAIKGYLATREDLQNTDWLFESRKGKGKITVNALRKLVKQWCDAINLEGNYGSHTLRKTFGYHQRVRFGMGTAILMEVFNHKAEKQTLDYLGVEKVEIRDVHLNNI